MPRRMIPHRTVLLGVALVIGSTALPPTALAHGTEKHAEIHQEPSEADQQLRPGTFSFTDHTGRAVTDKDFRGEHLLVTFGYTNCPDVCPAILFEMSSAVRILEKEGKRIRPVFVTIDPKRDTPEKLGPYVKAFHPRMLGLSGTNEQTKAAALAYRADYIATKLNGEYLVYHSSFIYLVNPDGQIAKTFPNGLGPAKLAEYLKTALEQ